MHVYCSVKYHMGSHNLGKSAAESRGKYWGIPQCLKSIYREFTVQCSCSETQTMSHIVESCPQTRLHGGLSKLHFADDDAVVLLTSYGS